MKFQRSQVIGTLMSVAVFSFSFSFLSPTAQVAAQDSLYKTCEELKLTEPLSKQASEATPEVVEEATAEVTPAASTTGEANIVFLSVNGADSEACYLASETFLENNMMNLPAGFAGAVGVSKTISADIALDLANLANSQIGDITINISEFKSDNDRRDGYIRENYLESNTYPFATLTNAVAIGLPNAAYEEGTTVKFQIKGTLNVHNTDRETTFDATGTYTDGTLVVTATTDLKMSEFGITVPDIAGLLKVDDDVRLVVNLVARAAEDVTPTPSS